MRLDQPRKRFSEVVSADGRVYTVDENFEDGKLAVIHPASYVAPEASPAAPVASPSA